jgi:hypothetical protein
MKSMPCESVPMPVLIPARAKRAYGKLTPSRAKLNAQFATLVFGFGEDLQFRIARATRMREDHVAAEEAGVARVLGGAHAVAAAQQRKLLRRLREMRGEDAAEVVRRLAAVAQQLGEARVGRMRADRHLGEAVAPFVARLEQRDRLLQLRVAVVAEVPDRIAVGAETRVRRRHDERRADGAQARLRARRRRRSPARDATCRAA